MRTPSADFECYFCKEQDITQPTVAHTVPIDMAARGTPGPLHEVHLECIRTWLATSDTCPICQKQANKSTVFSWKERAIIELKNIGKDALRGALKASICILGGALGGVASRVSTVIGSVLGMGIVCGGGYMVARGDLTIPSYVTVAGIIAARSPIGVGFAGLFVGSCAITEVVFGIIKRHYTHS